MKTKPKSALALFITFAKIGAFTFGGGYAMIPLIEKETVLRRNWITSEDLLEIVAIAESTPGPIAINTATFVGYRTAGFFGALCATIGVIVPSFLIIFALSFVMRQFRSVRAVAYAFNGIRAGVLALIIRALVTMYRQCKKSFASYLIIALSFAAVVIFGVNILVVIAASAACGLACSFLVKSSGATGGKEL